MTRSRHSAIQHSLRWTGAIALAASVAACGGGGSDDDDGGQNQLFGTAATGAPIAGGTVEVRCSPTQSGAAAPSTLTTTTLGNGTWSVDVSKNHGLPCAVRITSGNLALHSIAVEFNTVNITPLTDLLIANAAAQSPALWWSSGNFKDFTQQRLNTALQTLRDALKLSDLNGIDPRTGAFDAKAGDRIDDMLEALKKALANQQVSYGDLLATATSAQFALTENLRTALQAAYTAQRAAGNGSGTGGNNGGGSGTGNGGNNSGGSGTGNGGSSGTGNGGNNGGGSGSGTGNGGGTTVPGGGGNYTLKVAVTASGVAGPVITLTNIPKPANQSEFCDDLQGSSSTSLSNQLGGAAGASGTLTINNCSFNGTVGAVSATMAITSPIAMSVPYNVTYTYSN